MLGTKARSKRDRHETKDQQHNHSQTTDKLNFGWNCTSFKDVHKQIIKLRDDNIASQNKDEILIKYIAMHLGFTETEYNLIREMDVNTGKLPISFLVRVYAAIKCDSSSLPIYLDYNSFFDSIMTESLKVNFKVTPKQIKLPPYFANKRQELNNRLVIFEMIEHAVRYKNNSSPIWEYRGRAQLQEQKNHNMDNASSASMSDVNVSDPINNDLAIASQLLNLADPAKRKAPASEHELTAQKKAKVTKPIEVIDLATETDNTLPSMVAMIYNSSSSASQNNFLPPPPNVTPIPKGFSFSSPIHMGASLNANNSSKVDKNNTQQLPSSTIKMDLC